MHVLKSQIFNLTVSNSRTHRLVAARTLDWTAVGMKLFLLVSKNFTVNEMNLFLPHLSQPRFPRASLMTKGKSTGPVWKKTSMYGIHLLIRGCVEEIRSLHLAAFQQVGRLLVRTLHLDDHNQIQLPMCAPQLQLLVEEEEEDLLTTTVDSSRRLTAAL